MQAPGSGVLAATELRHGYAICAERPGLLFNEGAAANAFDRRALDRIRNVFAGARVAGVEVHGQIEVTGVVFFHTDPADSGLLK